MSLLEDPFTPTGSMAATATELFQEIPAGMSQDILYLLKGHQESIINNVIKDLHDIDSEFKVMEDTIVTIQANPVTLATPETIMLLEKQTRRLDRQAEHIAATLKCPEDTGTFQDVCEGISDLRGDISSLIYLWRDTAKHLGYDHQMKTDDRLTHTQMAKLDAIVKSYSEILDEVKKFTTLVVAPKQDNTKVAITATSLALQLDKLARHISNLQIDLGCPDEGPQRVCTTMRESQQHVKQVLQSLAFGEGL